MISPLARCATLIVRSHRGPRELWLVAAGDACFLAGERRRLSGAEAAAALLGMYPADRDIARFLAAIAGRGVRSGGDWREPRAQLVRMIQRGTIAVLVPSEAPADDQQRKRLREERRIARELTELGGKHALWPGRRCRLVAGDDYARLPTRERYQVVRHGEAMALLSAGAADSKLPPPVRELLASATRLLAPDWRLPKAPEGLVLLRELPQVAADGKREAPLTPSQLRALAQAEKKIKLEVAVVGVDGKLLQKLEVAVTMPDEETHESDLGGSGKVTVASAKNGRARVTLAWADRRGG